MISLTEAMRRLQEMLENKSQVRQDIVNVEGKIIEHLLKCFLYKSYISKYPTKSVKMRSLKPAL